MRPRNGDPLEAGSATRTPSSPGERGSEDARTDPAGDAFCTRAAHPPDATSGLSRRECLAPLRDVVALPSPTLNLPRRHCIPGPVEEVGGKAAGCRQVEAWSDDRGRVGVTPALQHLVHDPGPASRASHPASAPRRLPTVADHRLVGKQVEDDGLVSMPHAAVAAGIPRSRDAKHFRGGRERSSFRLGSARTPAYAEGRASGAAVATISTLVLPSPPRATSRLHPTCPCITLPWCAGVATESRPPRVTTARDR
jgi:hypothetical protein